MAARKPAIQTRQGHPQGIVDDVAKAIFKGVRKKIGTVGATAGRKVPSRSTVKKGIVSSRRQRDFNYIQKHDRTLMTDAEIAKHVGKATYRVDRKTVSAARKEIKKAYPYTTKSKVDKAAVKGLRKDKLSAVKENASYAKNIERMNKQKTKRLSANTKTTIGAAGAAGATAAGVAYATRNHGKKKK